MKNILAPCIAFLRKCNFKRFRPLYNSLCNRNHKNLLIYLILIVLFTVEVLLYFIATFSWYQIDCYWETECTRILLVADPQLIGLHNENSNLLTPISIWDSDRYLSKTYSYAFRFTKPDVVIFLGDLFDEGSTGTDAEFKIYLKRLFNIFLRKPYHAVHHIWLPGDNDIGGEGYDIITPQKVKRFERAFLQPDIIRIKDVQFYKINRLTGNMPVIKEHHEFSNMDSIRIGVSHLPLTRSPAVFVDKVIDKLQPHLLFTGHEHKSMIVTTQEGFRTDRLITPVRPDANQIYEYYLGVNDIYEILVPTCSYRMGTNKIGYGFAIIDGGAVRYTVLWSPSRFPQLVVYAIVIIIVIVYSLYNRYLRCSKKENDAKQYTRLSHIA